MDTMGIDTDGTAIKEAAKRKRGRSSGDHFEEQMDYAILLVFLIHVGIGVVIAGVLITMFFLIF